MKNVFRDCLDSVFGSVWCCWFRHLHEAFKNISARKQVERFSNRLKECQKQATTNTTFFCLFFFSCLFLSGWRGKKNREVIRIFQENQTVDGLTDRLTLVVQVALGVCDDGTLRQICFCLFWSFVFREKRKKKEREREDEGGTILNKWNQHVSPLGSKDESMRLE